MRVGAAGGWGRQGGIGVGGGARCGEVGPEEGVLECCGVAAGVAVLRCNARWVKGQACVWTVVGYTRAWEGWWQSGCGCAAGGAGDGVLLPLLLLLP